MKFFNAVGEELPSMWAFRLFRCNLPVLIILHRFVLQTRSFPGFLLRLLMATGPNFTVRLFAYLLQSTSLALQLAWQQHNKSIHRRFIQEAEASAGDGLLGA